MTPSAYRMALADKVRARIFDVIGWECEVCGERHGIEVNHVYQRDWTPRKINKYRRALRYWRELQAGVPLTPLCKTCNGTYRPRPWPVDATDTNSNPF